MAIFGGDSNSIIGWFSSAYDKAKDTASDTYDTATAYVDNFAENLKEQLSGVTSYFKSGYESLSSSMSNAWHKSVDAVQKPEGIINTALLKAQAMSSAAVDKLDNMTDLVKALTNWTVGFIMGFFTGMMELIKYIIQLGTSRVQGIFNIISAGMLEVGKFLGGIPKAVLGGLWDFVSRLTEGTGPFAPLLSILLIMIPIVLVLLFVNWFPKWSAERVAERG